MRYLPLTETDRRQMLALVGAKSIDDLYADVPKSAVLKDLIDLPKAQGELQVHRHMQRLAEKNMPAGRAAFFDGCTGARWTRSFFAAILPRQRVQAFICSEDLPDERFEFLLAAATGGAAAQTFALPPGRVFLLRDLRPDEREKVLSQVLKRRLERWAAAGRDQLEDALALAEQFRGLDIPLPPGLGEETLVALAHALADAAERFAQGVSGSLDELQSVVARAAAAGLSAPSARAEEPFAHGVERLLANLEGAAGEAAAEELAKAVDVAALAGLADWRPAAQVRVFRWLRTHKPSSQAAGRLAALLNIKL